MLMLMFPMAELPKLVQPILELEELGHPAGLGTSSVCIVCIVCIACIACPLHSTCGRDGMRRTWLHQKGTVFDWRRL